MLVIFWYAGKEKTCTSRHRGEKKTAHLLLSVSAEKPLNIFQNDILCCHMHWLHVRIYFIFGKNTSERLYSVSDVGVRQWIHF